MTDPVIIGNSNKWVKDTDSKIMTKVFTATNWLTSSVFDLVTGTKYTIPSGKKFIIISMIFQNISTSASNSEFWVSSSIDSRTGTKLINTTPASSNFQLDNTFIEIPNGKFMNCYGNENTKFYITGVEVDA